MNKEERKAYNKAYWQKNKDKLLKKQAEHNKKPDVAKRRREYYKEYNKTYITEEVKEKRREYSKEHYKKNK